MAFGFCLGATLLHAMLRFRYDAHARACEQTRAEGRALSAHKCSFNLTHVSYTVRCCRNVFADCFVRQMPFHSKRLSIKR